MMNIPTKSRVALIKLFKSNNGVVTFAQLWDFEHNPEIYFGPGVDAFDVFFSWVDLGKAQVDFDGQKCIVNKFAPKKLERAVKLNISDRAKLVLELLLKRGCIPITRSELIEFYNKERAGIEEIDVAQIDLLLEWPKRLGLIVEQEVEVLDI